MLKRHTHTHKQISHDSDALVINVVDADNTFRRRENVMYGRFVHQFIVPQLQQPSFPDLHLLGACYLDFWYTGRGSLTRQATPDSLNALFVYVSSYYKYVVHKSPLDLSK